jgi:hypothetical protein
MTTVQLSNLDARLVFLALQYHLSRPGSELQRETGGPPSLGLAAIAPGLEAQLDKAIVAIELSDEQPERLGSAIAGAINELKSTSLMAASGTQSMVPAFREALRRLFPDAVEDPDEALQLAGHLLTLRRRLEQLPRAAAEEWPQTKPQSRWRFWQRN